MTEMYRPYHPSFFASALRQPCMRLLAGAIVFSTTLSLAACSDDPEPDDLARPNNHLLREDRSANGGDDALANGVNAYLWRGALDTLSFMPFASADAVGGIILTDWYTPPATHNERFRISAYILSRRLRSDAIRVAVFRQIREGNQWVDTPAAATTASEITAKILARARQLRADSGGNGDE